MTWRIVHVCDVEKQTIYCFWIFHLLDVSIRAEVVWSSLAANILVHNDPIWQMLNYTDGLVFVHTGP